MRGFQTRARAHQVAWREAHGWAMGLNPHPADSHVPNPSMLHSDHGAAFRNFLGVSAPSRPPTTSMHTQAQSKIEAAVRHRMRSPQRGQQFDEDRLLHNLLSSMPMCFNLFGELHGDSDALLAAGVDLGWASDAGPAELIFEWSPDRHRNDYTGDGTAFDAAFLFGPLGGRRHVIGVETKYAERPVVEPRPHDTTRLPRYLEIVEHAQSADGTQVFRSGWEEAVLGTDLQQIWRDHLLLLAMLQRPLEWSGGKYVLAYPSENSEFGEVGERYRQVLNDDGTFCHTTIEGLLDQHVLHSPDTERDFRARYFW